MAQQQVRATGALDKVDPVWARIRREAEEVARREPELATFIYSTIVHHDTLEAAVVHRVTERLDSPEVSAGLFVEGVGNTTYSNTSTAAAVPTQTGGIPAYVTGQGDGAFAGSGVLSDAGGDDTYSMTASSASRRTSRSASSTANRGFKTPISWRTRSRPES